jgi:hypothetical protein
MKKAVIAMFLMGLSMEGANAGMMGSIPVGQDYFVPFVSGEADATWNTNKSVTIFGNSPSTSSQIWGGRGAVGVVHAGHNHWGYSSEVGWGYYGNTSSSSAGSTTGGSLSITNNSDFYGFDILVGLTYDVEAFRLYLKGGAMAENRYVNGYAQFQNSIGGSNYLSTNRLKTTATNVLPEIKVGGIYNFNEHLGLSLAYMHVFGNDNFSASVTGAFSNPQALAGISSVVSAQNPSLDSVMFGLVYNFA